MDIKKIMQKDVSSMSNEEKEFLINHLITTDEESALDYLLDVVDNQLPGDDFTGRLLSELENANSDDKLMKISKELNDIKIETFSDISKYNIKLPEYDLSTKNFLADNRLRTLLRKLY